MAGEILTQDEISHMTTEFEAERNYWRTAPGIFVDPVTEASFGSFWARRWSDYAAILHHNGAPNTVLKMIEDGNTAPRIVDAGCAAGVALADLRRYLPDAELYGVDVRNAAMWTISDPNCNLHTSGRKWFSDHHIDFYQDSYHAVPEILPPYDLLFCVGAMPDKSSSPTKQLYVLQQFYKGLTVGGYAQVLMQSSEEHLSQTMQKLASSGVESEFIPGDQQILQDNFFDSQNGLWGTLTLGPKSD